MDTQWSLSNQLETISKYLFYGVLIGYVVYIVILCFGFKIVAR